MRHLRKFFIIGLVLVMAIAMTSCDSLFEEKEDRSTTTTVVLKDGNTEYREEVNKLGEVVRWEKVERKDNGDVVSTVLMEDRNWYK